MPKHFDATLGAIPRPTNPVHPSSWMRPTGLIHAVLAASRPFEISQATPDCPKRRFRAIRLLSRFSVTRHTQNDQSIRSRTLKSQCFTAFRKSTSQRRSDIRVDPGSLSNPRNFRGYDLTEKPRIKPLGFFRCLPRVLVILVLPTAKQRALSFRPKIAFPRPDRANSSATLRFSV